MGMPYALLKRDKAEAFDLGKGSRLHGWPQVFDRRYGYPFGQGEGNFCDPLQDISLNNLTKKIEDFDNKYTGDPATVAQRIIDWMGDDVCFLVNYWEEIEGMIESGESDRLAEEFSDLKLEHALKDYKQTGSVWG